MDALCRPAVGTVEVRSMSAVALLMALAPVVYIVLVLTIFTTAGSVGEAT